jgi:flagellar protein FliO/FliZ
MQSSAFFIASAAGLFAHSALAQAKSETDANPLLGHLTQSALGLVLIVALLFAFSYLVKRINPQAAQRKLIRTIGAHSLGARERITIVELEGKWLVIGSTPGSINLLHIIDKPAQGSQASNQDTSTSGFAAQLRSLLERRSNA